MAAAPGTSGQRHIIAPSISSKHGDAGVIVRYSDILQLCDFDLLDHRWTSISSSITCAKSVDSRLIRFWLTAHRNVFFYIHTFIQLHFYTQTYHTIYLRSNAWTWIAGEVVLHFLMNMYVRSSAHIKWICFSGVFDVSNGIKTGRCPKPISVPRLYWPLVVCTIYGWQNVIRPKQNTANLHSENWKWTWPWAVI